jgi:hypothetical protein
MPPLRRYAPFLVLVAVQLVLAMAVPSRPSAPAQVGAPLLAAEDGTGVPLAGTPGAPSVAATPAAAGVSAPGAAASAGGAVGGGTAARPSAGPAGPHCVTGLISPPPCVPTWAGGSNGGATSAGVTGTSVTVLMYHNKENPASSAIVKQIGVYMSPEQETAYLAAAGRFIKARFQLYGRSLKLIHVVGQCEIAPPDAACFRSEAASLVTRYKPFAVFWVNNMNETAFFDELSRRGVVNWGGWSFTDGYSRGLRPFHWDVMMGGDKQADIAAEYWCKRLANRPARYGGSDVVGKPRKVAVLAADTPGTAPAARRLLSRLQECDRNGPSLQLYSSSTVTAATQSSTTMAQLRRDGVTSVLWFSDPIAPVYATATMSSQNFYPEHVLAGNDLLDYDALGQAYDQNQWRNAFGLSNLFQLTTTSKSDAGRVWVAGGGTDADALSPYASIVWAYLSMVAVGIERAGPTLTPLTFERGLLTMPGYGAWEPRHDTRVWFSLFGRDDYTAISDVREVVWDADAVSPVNGRQGAYVALEKGRRYQLGQLPASTLALPGRG